MQADQFVQILQAALPLTDVTADDVRHTAGRLYMALFSHRKDDELDAGDYNAAVEEVTTARCGAWPTRALKVGSIITVGKYLDEIDYGVVEVQLSELTWLVRWHGSATQTVYHADDKYAAIHSTIEHAALDAGKRCRFAPRKAAR